MNLGVIILLLTIVGLSNCQRSSSNGCFGEGLPNSPDTFAVSKGAEDFAIDIFKRIALKYPKHNIVLSPYSIWSVLKLAYYGTGSNTATQLQKALGVPSKSDAFYGGNIVDLRLTKDKGTTFLMTNKAYFDSSVSLKTCAFNLLPGLESVDFSDTAGTMKLINDVVSKATQGKINKFLNQDAIAGKMFVLLNAIYFKGTWNYKFDPQRTDPKRTFYEDDGKTSKKPVKMMFLREKLRHVDSNELGASVLELPYSDSNIAMYLILPNDGETVNNVLNKVTPNGLAAIINNMRLKMSEVFVPRFKMTTRIATELKEALIALGITDLFDASAADLSNFIEGQQMFVDQTLHHSTIEVTEEGTIATAATGLIGTRSGASDIVKFIADKPFIYLIRDKIQGITLFMGVFRDADQLKDF